MNERLPYEEQLAEKWDELSLPDEDIAWADMRRRLEKKDDDGFIPFWLRGCALWGILAVLLVAVGLWIIRSEKWFVKEKNATKNETRKKSQTRTSQMNDSTQVVLQQKNISAPSQAEEQDSRHNQVKTTAIERKKKAIRPEDLKNGSQQKSISKNKHEDIRRNIANKTKQIKRTSQDKEISKIEEPVANKKVDNIDNKRADSSKKGEQGIKITDQVTGPKNHVTVNIDTIGRKNSDSTRQRNRPVTSTNEKKQIKRQISFAAGLSLQQQLPINGQKLTPYNSAGRKGSLADYIPSVYVRMYRQDKWFVQSEFRYGAPQYTKEFLYKQKIVSDTFQRVVTTTSNRLKKTFYHQLPLTFNYFLLPRWSIGGGVIWNKFVSAVSEQDIIKHDNLSGIDTVVSKGVIINPQKTDSNFVNSYFQAVFETQYKFKRFSVGTRYAFGLQPYLKFKLPGGSAQQEKNSSINLFVRYELWRSRN